MLVIGGLTKSNQLIVKYQAGSTIQGSFDQVYVPEICFEKPIPFLLSYKYDMSGTPPGKIDDYGLSKILVFNDIYVPASG